MKQRDLYGASSRQKKTGNSPDRIQRSRTEIAASEKSMKTMKAAMILLPALIALIVIAALIVGVNQYNGMFSTGNENGASSDSEGRIQDDEEKLLMIVSPDNPLPSDYSMELTSFEGVQVDQMVLADLQQLLKDAGKEKLDLVLTEGYVSVEQQHERYIDEVNRLKATQGYGESRALEEAEKTVPMENHSEAQTGLLLRFSADNAGQDFTLTDEYLWLCRHCVRYGFVQRYPEGKEGSTGFAFDPGQFRYVGKDIAAKLQTLNMCLDEYVYYLDSRR